MFFGCKNNKKKSDFLQEEFDKLVSQIKSVLICLFLLYSVVFVKKFNFPNNRIQQKQTPHFL